MHEWSNAEKKIARRAYETAREAVLSKTLGEFKAQAAAATDIDDMWSIVDAFHQRRREVQDLLDYRYSQLPLVFSRLIFEGYLDERELAGLSGESLEEIRRTVAIFRSR